MKYENTKYDKERSLYGIKKSQIENCDFSGKEDGESPLKECEEINVLNTSFNLRYPLWHLTFSTIDLCDFKENARAALWYGKDIVLSNLSVNSVKFMRECEDICIKMSDFTSEEFGWMSKNIEISDSYIDSLYAFLNSKDIVLKNIRFAGKYSFQYMENVFIENSTIEGRDAFWHAKNVTVINSIISGEYLAWHSENLRLVNCHIKGTQPLCYAKNLILENCTMDGADGAFEYSTINAKIIGKIESVFNPTEGTIEADEIGNVILDSAKKPGIVNIIDHSKESF
ncbi:MAG: DUF3737 family protein [Bacillales bacterium]|nr:DUF3737 family protein [Bacillales bacterium]